jgi:hypothetical protein
MTLVFMLSENCGKNSGPKDTPEADYQRNNRNREEIA